MIIYPAIDIKGGECVRLYQGDMDDAVVYGKNPAKQALGFENAGFSWIHVVDLDGAVEGKPVNADVVREIVKTVNVPVQLGGGIRNLEQIEYWLDIGVNRVILGTIAVREPELVKDACRKYPEKIVIGIDARNGDVAVDGWVKGSGIDAVTLGKKFEDVGAAAIVFTDISRDGTEKGVNLDKTVELAKTVSIPVIASGGVGCLDDVRAVAEAEKYGVKGVIIGKALYEKSVNAGEALEIQNA